MKRVRETSRRGTQVYTTLVALTDKQEGAQNCIDNRGVPMLVEKLKLGSNPVIEPLVLQAPPPPSRPKSCLLQPLALMPW